MSWFPWAKPPARSNITVVELVDWLRYRAIEFGAPPQFIEALDDLTAGEDLEYENERLRDRLTMARRTREARGL